MNARLEFTAATATRLALILKAVLPASVKLGLLETARTAPTLTSASKTPTLAPLPAALIRWAHLSVETASQATRAPRQCVLATTSVLRNQTTVIIQMGSALTQSAASRAAATWGLHSLEQMHVPTQTSAKPARMHVIQMHSVSTIRLARTHASVWLDLRATAILRAIRSTSVTPEHTPAARTPTVLIRLGVSGASAVSDTQALASHVWILTSAMNC